jgi:hypothetical protein
MFKDLYRDKKQMDRTKMILTNIFETALIWLKSDKKLSDI